MSDLTGKMIQIPANLQLPGVATDWNPRCLRRYSESLVGSSDHCPHLAAHDLFNALADEIERQHPPRMDEPDEFGAMVEAKFATHGREQWLAGEPDEAPSAVGRRWWRNEHGDLAAWVDLIDPRPVGGAS